jgi:hypothetical protein
MTWGAISFYFITIFIQDRLGSHLIRRDPDHLSPHLAAGHARFSTKLGRLKRSIDLNRNLQQSL